MEKFRCDNKLINVLYNTILSLLTILISTFMLEFTVVRSLSIGDYPEFKYIFTCISAVAFMWSVILFVFNRIWLSSIICEIVCGTVAIVNYYVIMFHGMPLSFMMIKNMKTAMNVVGSYNFPITKSVIRIILLALFIIILSLISKFVFVENKLKIKGYIIRNLIIAVLCYYTFYISFLSPTSIKPEKTITWLWTEPYYQYGYTACTVESFLQSSNYINKPENYNDPDMEQLYQNGIDKVEKNNSTPDVILILNETFYDLREIADIDTDVPFMENIDNMNNLYKGYAVVPQIGGGTNNSEYELLTSNSLQLMPAITPFNVINMHGENSIVSHLEELGYASFGAHSESSANYSRGLRYNDMGFDNAYFEKDFTDVKWHRWFEDDESIYKNLINWYENMPEDQPRFAYLLTIQNHGSWDIDSDNNDTVHIQGDFGENTDDINEYLSCIRLSDIAFKDLTDYFSDYDRDIVICMVGDHSPAFASSIIENEYETDKELLLRRTPLLVWANFELEKNNLDTISMNYVVPTVLEMADIPVSFYYDYMLKIREQIPVISSYNRYYDSVYNWYDYSDINAVHKDLVNNYFYLEYNNLQSLKLKELFTPVS